METGICRSNAETVDLSLFKDLLLRSCGHAFENEREQTLSAALCRRMAARDIDCLNSYHALLMRDEPELRSLTELLTVNETYFFREPGHLNLMVDKLLPELMHSRNHNPVRILSAGCSTGEEPYSIAIMLRERFGSDAEKLFRIVGVDIDSTAINTARKSVYGRNSFRGINQALLQRYFEPAGAGEYSVREELKRQVLFDVVNLLGQPYPETMLIPDIILYRNVSIYFPGEVQREIFARLAAILVDGGCMMVGASETFHHDIGLLSLVQRDTLFFYKKTPGIVFEERRASSRAVLAPESTRKYVSQRVFPRESKTEVNNSPLQSSLQGRVDDKVINIKENFDKALALAQNKELDKSLEILEDVITQDKRFTKAHTLKGSLLLTMGRFEDARGVCETIMEQDSLSLAAHLLLGMIARQNGDEEGALKRFREAIYLDASCWLAHFYSAELMFARKETKRARSSYEAALRVLEKGSMNTLGHTFFPLSFNAEQFAVICRHKLSILTSTRIKG
ncbi:MAG: tetratricopeptide repeat protein [Desulfuromonadaceae bacterium]|nr:tetratricopeptide repeat protein [Desulfuromonadaceae bacterium]MDD2854610.1 tetratricopeptide repeat protein [Desulfuromonadaceae bacterium]